MKAEFYIFDLDFTLWDCGGTWCDHTRPPFRKDGEHIRDSAGRLIRLYPDVLDILGQLSSRGIPLAVASRTGEPSWAENLMRMFDIHRYFDYREIYPGSKRRHFESLRNRSGIPFENMIFFDDEWRNVEEVSRLGVEAVFVKNGITKELLAV